MTDRLKQLSRRDFLKGAGAAGGGLLAILFGRTNAQAADQLTSKVVLPNHESVISGDLFRISGVAEEVDPDRVDTAKGTFKNTLGEGTEGWLAEPGKLLVGPDFDPKKIKEAKGAIEYFNPLNQDVLRTNGPEYVQLPAGGFTMLSLGYGTVEVQGVLDGGVDIVLDGEKGHNWFLIVRGLYGDGKRDTDENQSLKLSNYEPGHNEVRTYPGQPNGGFISEGQFKQMTGTSGKGGSNCGDAGCSKLSALMLDANTGAFTVITRESPDKPFKMVASNWK